MFIFDKSNETFDSNHKKNEIEVVHPLNYEYNEVVSTTMEETETNNTLPPTLEEEDDSQEEVDLN